MYLLQSMVFIFKKKRFSEGRCCWPALLGLAGTFSCASHLETHLLEICTVGCVCLGFHLCLFVNNS